MPATLPHVVVIGAGPAGLMAAEAAADGGATVTVYDRMAAPGRKLLLAGRGGLNLTHSENIELLLARYGAAATRLRPAIESFPPEALRNWCESLGQTTFVGSSGRIFPTAFRASPLLRAWIARLKSKGVVFSLRHQWTGWDEAGLLRFVAPGGLVEVRAEATVLALGGASWPRFGSDASWAETMRRNVIEVSPLKPANCGFLVSWSDIFRTRFEGEPLKNIELSFDGRSARGEALVTRTGIEGGGVYALSAQMRDAIAASGEAIVEINLRPDLGLTTLEAEIALRPAKQSLATFLRKSIRLQPVAIGLLHESAGEGPERLSSMNASQLAKLIHAAPLRLIGVAPIERAISTAGGITFTEIDSRFMLVNRPGVFVAGEMIDWEAPTGGYLLQACFATGAAAGAGVVNWLFSSTRMGTPDPRSSQPSLPKSP
ncbi:TIGR03862 family flavoprotein [Methylocapsa acidiphila]|uniref:TIGR03862 family flavoprotein n=1 Tax=Methylocapsa acidiphila TaxID=133552 RepID=UPI00041E36A1|nr:TIGR03862 family flavoprotein [Methylocapsa acidiphila]